MSTVYYNKRTKGDLFKKTFFQLSLEDVYFYEMFVSDAFMSGNIEKDLFPTVNNKRLFEMEEIIEYAEQVKFDDEILEYVQTDTPEEELEKLEKSINDLIRSENPKKRVRFSK